MLVLSNSAYQLATQNATTPLGHSGALSILRARRQPDLRAYWNFDSQPGDGTFGASLPAPVRQGLQVLSGTSRCPSSHPPPDHERVLPSIRPIRLHRRRRAAARAGLHRPAGHPDRLVQQRHGAQPDFDGQLQPFDRGAGNRPGGLQDIIGDLHTEIVAGSVSSTGGTNTVYVPRAAAGLHAG